MVKRVLKSLGTRIVGEAQARGLVAVNNVRAVAKLKRERRAERIEMQSRTELQAIIAATPDRHRPLILTAMLTGMRGSRTAWTALGGLRSSAADYVHQRVDRFNKFGSPKSEAGTRTIPGLSPLLLNTLRQWRLACPKGELGLVFPNGIEGHANLLHRLYGRSRSRQACHARRQARREILAPCTAPRLRGPMDRARIWSQADPNDDGPRLRHPDL